MPDRWARSSCASTDRMKLQTRLSIDDCKARLAASVDPVKLGWTISGYAGSQEILGKIWGNSFRLQKRRNYRNSFAPYLYEQFMAGDGATRVEGEFRLHPFTKLFMALWFSFLAAFAAGVLVLPSHGQAESARWPLLLFAAGMAAFGVALIKFSRWLARNEGGAIVALLKNKFEASDVA